MGKYNCSFNPIAKNDKKPLPSSLRSEKVKGLVTIVSVLPRTAIKIGNARNGVNELFNYFLATALPAETGRFHSFFGGSGRSRARNDVRKCILATLASRSGP
jgi:hypothetical protein